MMHRSLIVIALVVGLLGSSSARCADSKPVTMTKYPSRHYVTQGGTAGEKAPVNPTTTSPEEKTFKMGVSAVAAAPELKALLDEIKYDDVVQKFFFPDYLEHTLFELARESGYVEWKKKELEEHAKEYELEPRQLLALKFFLLGEKLSNSQLQVLFGDGQRELVRKLVGAKIAVKSDDGIRLDDYSIHSHKLPPGVMYTLSDLPQELAKRKTEPTAQLSSTSNRLLKAIVLQQELMKERAMEFEGVAADFGSGTGIQSMALLLMNPKLKEVIGLEIDPHSMGISQFNSRLNGVGLKYHVMDNHDPKKLSEYLDGKKLTLAVSNPPFNQVPEVVKGFTVFGDGGPRGLDVVKIFLEQAIPNLKSNGQFLMYAELAKTESGRALLEDEMRKAFGSNKELGLATTLIPVSSVEPYTAERYAGFLKKFLKGPAYPGLHLRSSFTMPLVSVDSKLDFRGGFTVPLVSILVPLYPDVVFVLCRE